MLIGDVIQSLLGTPRTPCPVDFAKVNLMSVRERLYASLRLLHLRRIDVLTDDLTDFDICDCHEWSKQEFRTDVSKIRLWREMSPTLYDLTPEMTHQDFIFGFAYCVGRITLGNVMYSLNTPELNYEKVKA